MPLYAGFSPESSTLIVEALHFVAERIDKYLNMQKQAINPLHHNVVQAAYQEEMDRINRVIKFIQTNASDYGLYVLSEGSNNELMNVVRSGLEVYLKDTVKVRDETGLSTFDSKIQAIKETINLEGPKKAKADVYDKYYQMPALQKAGKRIELFISYSNRDKIIAGKIAELLGKKGIDVFLAHEDIEVSEEWRAEILKHLNNDDYMISLLTENYAQSTWGNQEAGYMMGKSGKNISIIFDGVDVKKFAFLESLQGISANQNNIEVCIDKIIDLIFK